MSDASSAKRNLPSWMSSDEKGSKARRKKQDDNNDDDNSQFPRLLDGVVFVLSGFVNPERSTLRSQALEMGAEYKPDWSPDCTLLVSAFSNTPKFRQVEADCGTIVSKEWISECYSQKKLVDIERFLMHAGKPWRKTNNQTVSKKGQKDASHGEPRKRPGRKSSEKLSGSAVSKGGPSNAAKDHFSPSMIKEWAIDDLDKTISWLQSQEEKPEANEVKSIAAQGIVTCLQDAIESLKENKDMRPVMEQWMFVPHVVKELVELESGRSKKGSLSVEELCELAITCKKVYESEYGRLDGSPRWKGKHKFAGDEEDNGNDSDQTIEMTEEEIEIACKQLNS